MRFLAPLVLLGLALTPATAQSQKPLLDPNAAGPAQRIWSTVMLEHQELWFRRRFTLPKGATLARIAVSCDNECTVFVNGKRVGSAHDHQVLTVIDIEALRAGANAIAVHAKNTGGPGALVLWFTWVDASKTRHDLVTDRNWRVSDVHAAGWEALGFDDKKWQAAKEMGHTPFARNVYGSPPRSFVFVNPFAEAADPIERGLRDMRSARDAKAALRALNAIEAAVMAARRKIQGRRKKRAAKRR